MNPDTKFKCPVCGYNKFKRCNITVAPYGFDNGFFNAIGYYCDKCNLQVEFFPQYEKKVNALLFPKKKVCRSFKTKHKRLFSTQCEMQYTELPFGSPSHCCYCGGEIEEVKNE